MGAHVSTPQKARVKRTRNTRSVHFIHKCRVVPAHPRQTLRAHRLGHRCRTYYYGDKVCVLVRKGCTLIRTCRDSTGTGDFRPGLSFWMVYVSNLMVDMLSALDLVSFLSGYFKLTC